MLKISPVDFKVKTFYNNINILFMKNVLKQNKYAYIDIFQAVLGFH